MEMLGAIFTVGIIIAVVFLLWLNSKRGKKWLSDL